MNGVTIYKINDKLYEVDEKRFTNVDDMFAYVEQKLLYLPMSFVNKKTHIYSFEKDFRQIYKVQIPKDGYYYITLNGEIMYSPSTDRGFSTKDAAIEWINTFVFHETLTYPLKCKLIGNLRPAAPLPPPPAPSAPPDLPPAYETVKKH